MWGVNGKEKNVGRPLKIELAPLFVKAIAKAEALEAGPDGRRNFPELAPLLIKDAYDIGASDIHIEPHRAGMCVRLRLDGLVWDLAHISTALGKALINQFKAVANLDPITRFTPRDAHASMEFGNDRVDLRLALAPTFDSDTVAIRMLDPRRLEKSINELGLETSSLQTLVGWLEDTTGMFLSTGPTGSGKTTTLYAILHALKASNRVLITLEDPVEYRVDGISQIQVDELHHLHFAEGIKALLRHDPDFLMLGEVRDGVSGQTAVNAAISGRVLLSTMHSRDSVGAITALRNWGLPDHEIAESVSVILSQRLVRKLCLQCCQRREPTQEETDWLRSLGLEVPRHLWEGIGCEACRYLGYKGRTGVFELWRLDDSDYQMILRHADEHRLRMHLYDKGHRFLLQTAAAKMEQGVTTLEEVQRAGASQFPGINPDAAEEVLVRDMLA